MEKEAVLATLSDFWRIVFLARAGFFPWWMPLLALYVMVRYPARILWLRLKFTFIRYPGPRCYN